MRLPALVFAITSLIFGVILAWVIATKTINWLESSQIAELEQSMFAGGINWVEFEADGFVVSISGEAPDKQQQERAIQIASMIIDTGLVNTTTVAEPVVIAQEFTRPMVEIMRNGTDISLIGRLPVGTGRAVLDAGITALSGETTLVDISEPYLDELPDGWQSALGFGTRILSQTDQAIITVTPGQVVVNAVAGSANWQDGLRELLENMRPPDVILHINIAAPRQVISPYRFALDFADPSSAICSARTELESQLILQHSKALTLPDFNCEIGIGAPSADWGNVVTNSLETLISLGAGSITIEDSDITIIAPVGTDADGFAISINALRAKLPDVYSLSTTIPEPPPSPEEIAAIIPVEFLATLSRDGFVTLSGAVRDDLTSDVVVRYAESKFAYNLVEATFLQHDTLPDGWQKRVFTSIEALSLLENGQIIMTPETLEITGVASFESPEQELSKLLKAALGPRLEYTLTLDYQPRDETDKDKLDPRICAARVTTILSDNQISFAPSSAVIEESSKPTIEAITAILTNCRDAEFEIGGHTDSQGREEMNLALSQSRADAVLDSIMAQNLLLGTITAVGYGEAEPIADNATEAGRASNRRIVIKLLRNTAHDPEEENSDEQN